MNEQTYIQVSNNGWFIAEFYITYISNGRMYTGDDSGAFPIGQTRRLNIDPRVQGVILKVEVWILGYDIILINNYVNTQNPRCYNLTGTIFNPNIDEVQCLGNSLYSNYNQVYSSCNCYNYGNCNKATIPAMRVF